MLALVQDFLRCYNLQYSLNVLQSETDLVSVSHVCLRVLAFIGCRLQGAEAQAMPDRTALARQLHLQQPSSQRPLLAELLSNASAPGGPSTAALKPAPGGGSPSPQESAQDNSVSSPAMSSPGAGLSSPSPLKHGEQPALGGALHHSPSSQQLLLGGASPPAAGSPDSPSQEATDDELAAALSAALQGDDTPPPPAAQAPAFGLSALPSLSLGAPGSLEGLRESLPQEEPQPAAPRGRPDAHASPGRKLDISDSFEDTLGSSGKAPPSAAQQEQEEEEEEYGDDEDWEEEDLPDEVSDDGSGSPLGEEEEVLSTAVPIAELASNLSPGKRSPGGSLEADEFALSMGDSRSMGDSGALHTTPAPTAGGGVASPVTSPPQDASAGPLDDSWTTEGEEAQAALAACDLQEPVQQ